MLSWSVTAPAGTSRESACARRTTSPSFGYRPTRQNSIRWRTSGTISAATNSAGLSGTAMKPSSPPARTLGSSSSEIRSASIPSPVAPGHGSIFRAVGITSGFIVPDVVETKGYKLYHYDVIIFDAMNAPVLWTDVNPDQADQGKKRAIPARYVYSVIEVKAAFSITAAKNALQKLSELNNLAPHL